MMNGVMKCLKEIDLKTQLLKYDVAQKRISMKQNIT